MVANFMQIDGLIIRFSIFFLIIFIFWEILNDSLLVAEEPGLQLSSKNESLRIVLRQKKLSNLREGWFFEVKGVFQLMRAMF